MIESEEYYFEKWIIAKNHIKDLEKQLNHLKQNKDTDIKKAVSDIKLELGIVTSEKDEAIAEVERLNTLLLENHKLTKAEVKQLKLNALVSKYVNQCSNLSKQLELSNKTRATLIDKLRKLEKQMSPQQ